jgi:hypothetical protein
VIVRVISGALLAPLFLAACMVGSSGSSYPPAKGPAGATVSLDLQDKRRITGELLAVEEATLLLLQEREVIRVAVAVIRSGKAPKIRLSGPNLDGTTREQLRLVSRYPQGVSPELEARLLQAYGTTSVGQVP